MSAYIVAVTGASGAIYAKNMLQALNKLKLDVYLTITDAGDQVIREELGWNLPDINQPSYLQSFKNFLNWNDNKSQITYFDYRDIGARIASGSARTKGMIIIPCTAGTLSGVAVGASQNLVERAADIMMKEARPLIMVFRETPINQIHLRNMLTLSSAGVHIVPAAPAFYHKPQTIDDLVNFVVGKVLDLLEIEHNLFTRWQGSC